MAFDVGKDIEALCKTCGDVWHVIFSKDGEKITKVECKQCGKRHRFKPTGDAPEVNLKASRKSAVSGSGTTARKTGGAQSRSKSAGPAFDPQKPVRPYSIHETFDVGEQVQHKTFGQGVVWAVESRKIRVNFSDGLKALVAGRD